MCIKLITCILQKFQMGTKTFKKRSPKNSNLSFFISHRWNNHCSFYTEYEIFPIYLTGSNKWCFDLCWNCAKKSNNHEMFEVGRELWKSPSPHSLFTKSQLKQIPQDPLQSDEDSTTSLGNLFLCLTTGFALSVKYFDKTKGKIAHQEIKIIPFPIHNCKQCIYFSDFLNMQNNIKKDKIFLLHCWMSEWFTSS